MCIMNSFPLFTKTVPLCFLPSGKLVCYKRGDILVLENQHVDRTIPVFRGAKERLIGRIRYLYRMLRLGVRAAVALDEDNILLSFGNFIYELNLSSGKRSSGFFCGNGIRPLSFTKVNGILSIDDGIYFGGYIGNTDKKTVNIYKRSGVDSWKVVYTFPQGTINHVHTIVSDPYRNCLWIFTGDFGEAAAIWKVEDGFRKVERVCCNNQKYRVCASFSLPEGLLYATDAPFTDNYIYLMNTKDYSMKSIIPIDGSCIYSCQWRDAFVFSSTVEGDGRNIPRMEFLFGRKRGAGVKNDYVHMYCGNISAGFKEIYKEKKDWLPFYTFQFGVFRFPHGANNSNELYFQPVATQDNDCRLMVIKDI